MNAYPIVFYSLLLLTATAHTQAASSVDLTVKGVARPPLATLSCPAAG